MAKFNNNMSDTGKDFRRLKSSRFVYVIQIPKYNCVGTFQYYYLYNCSAQIMSLPMNKLVSNLDKKVSKATCLTS